MSTITARPLSVAELWPLSIVGVTIDAAALPREIRVRVTDEAGQGVWHVAFPDDGGSVDIVGEARDRLVRGQYEFRPANWIAFLVEHGVGPGEDAAIPAPAPRAERAPA